MKPLLVVPKSEVYQCMQYTDADEMQKFIRETCTEEQLTVKYKISDHTIEVDTINQEIVIEFNDFVLFEAGCLCAYSPQDFEREYRKIGTVR